MKIRDKKSERGCKPKRKVFSASSFELCCCALQFALVICCLLTPLSKAEVPSDHPSPNHISEALLPENSPGPNIQEVEVYPGNLTSDLTDQLWKARIGTPTYQEDVQTKRELGEIIEQVSSVRFRPEKTVSERVVVTGPTRVIEPNEKLPPPEDSRKPVNRTIESELPRAAITDQTLQILMELLQNPERIEDPFRLGEILFLSGNMKEAAALYREALNRTEPNDVWSVHDTAWVQFQIGNCLRNDNPPEAKKAYRQLITGYPDSPWVEIAKAYDKLIDWHQQDKPLSLIGSRGSQASPERGDQRNAPKIPMQ